MTLTVKMFDVIEWPTGSFGRLLRWARERGLRAVLVVRDPELITDYSVLNGIARDSTRIASPEWPGTRLLRGTATVWAFDLTAPVLSVFESVRDPLWFREPRPEDFGLLRQDGSVFMATIAHEDLSYFLCDDEEHLVLQDIGIGLRDQGRVAEGRRVIASLIADT